MTWKLTDIPDLSSKVAVVTGANGGLGLETAKALAGANAHVAMAVRNMAKAESARAEILAKHPNAQLELVELDLGSQSSAKAAAQRIRQAHPKVDLLVNNAGVMAMPKGSTADGFETQFGINHLGHWTFTAGLMESLLAADSARVVTVTSTAHHLGRAVDSDDLNLDKSYDAWLAYGRAKLANFHFGLGLQKEFAKRGARAQSLIAHPGLSNTDLQTETVIHGGGGPLATFALKLTKYTGMSPANGALPQLRAATDPKAKGGEFYGPRFVNNGWPVRLPILRPHRDRDIATLWEVSEKATGVKLFDQ